MKLNIDGTDVDVAWEDNQAVADLKALAAAGPVAVEMRRYGGFEQVGPLGASLTASDVQTTTESGDIVLHLLRPQLVGLHQARPHHRQDGERDGRPARQRRRGHNDSSQLAQRRERKQP